MTTTKTLGLTVCAFITLTGPLALADEPAKGTGLEGITNSIDKSANSAAKDTEHAVNGETGKLAPGSKFVVDGTKKKVKRDCTGLIVDVTGNDNTVTLKGECKEVVLSGNGNTVNAQATERITCNGNKNTVTWAKKIKNAVPVVAQLGSGNKVTQKGGK